MTSTDGGPETATWAALFERAAPFDVTEEEVRAALAARRDADE